MSEKLKPELRFPQFDEDWNETTFDSHYSFKPTNSLSRDKLNYEAGTVKNIHYGDIHTEFDLLFDVTIEKVPFINDDVNIDNIDDENYVQKGDLVIADASEDYADIGKAIEIINTNNEPLLAGLHTFLARREDDKVAEGFFTFLLNTYKARYEIMRIAQGTKVLGLSKNRLGEIPLYIPKPDEQQKIANFLKAIDKRIKLLKAKKDALEDYKTSIMQKLFAQETRFKQDDGSDFPEWEEKSLGEVANITTGSSNREDSGLDGMYAFFDRSVDVRTSDIYLFDKEAVIVPGEGSDFIPKYFIGKFDLHQRTYAVFDFEGVIGKFIYYRMQYSRKHLLRQAVGITAKSLRLPMFKNWNILIPSLSEQEKIAGFLTKTDIRIDCLNKSVNDCIDVKNSFLQKMFV